MSDKKLPINLIIGAVDNVSLKVMAINERIKHATAPMKALGSSVSLLGKESGATELARGLGEAGKQSRELMRSVVDFGVKAAASVAAVSAAILEVERGFAESGEQNSFTAKQLGMTTDAYQELSYAAKSSGVSQEMFDSSMRKLSKNIVDTASGTGEALAGFEAMGVQVQDSTGHIKTLDQILPEIANGLSRVHNQNLRNAISMRLFGREGAQLNEMFSHGAKGLEALRAHARSIGGIMTPQQIEEAERVNQGFKDIGFTLEGIRNTVGAALGPALLELFGELRTWVTQNRGEIKKFAEQFGRDLPGYIHEAVGAFQDLMAVIKPVIGAIEYLAQIFGPVKLALATLFVYLGGGGIIAQFIQLSMTIIKLLGPALRLAWTLFSGLWPVLTGIAEALAAIVGWPVLIGAAFVAAAVAIWKYWGPISKFFGDLWDKVKAIAGFGAIGAQSPTFPQVPGQPTVDGTQSGSQGQSHYMLGPPVGAANTVASSQQAVKPPVQQTELKVIFENAPKGTKVQTKKADTPVDHMMGYGMAAVGS